MGASMSILTWLSTATNSLVRVSDVAPLPGSDMVTADGINFQPAREPNVFKATTAVGTSSAVWTPAAGKRFRLLKYSIDLPAGAFLTAAGTFTVQLEDATTSINFLHSIWLPGTAPTPTVASMAYSTGWIDLGKIGYLSTAVNNVLNFVSASSLASGSSPFRIRVAGTEE
jgi:hypothetical protein